MGYVLHCAREKYEGFGKNLGRKCGPWKRGAALNMLCKQ
jgi:hypothetical protein